MPRYPSPQSLRPLNEKACYPQPILTTQPPCSYIQFSALLIDQSNIQSGFAAAAADDVGKDQSMAPWHDDGITHFQVSLKKGANGFGLTFYQRHESYHQNVDGKK